VIIGDFGVAGQVSAADQVNGGAGTDELQLYGAWGTLPTSITNIEKINISGYGENKSISLATASATEVTLRNQTTAGTGDTTLTINANQAVVLNTVQDSGNGANELIIAGAATITSNSLTLNKAGDSARTAAFATGATTYTAGNDLEIEIAGTAVATLNIATTGNGSRISLNDETNTGDFAVATINLTGDQTLRIDALAASSATKVTIAAGSYTGALDLNLSATENFEVTGGTGSDRFVFASAFDASDKVAGGEGTDTVAVDTTTGLATWLNGKTSGVSNHSSVEIVEYTGTTFVAIDNAVTLSSVTGYKTSGAIAGDAASAASGGEIGLTVTNQANAQTYFIDANITGGTGDANSGAGGSGSAGVKFSAAIDNASNILNLVLNGVTITGGTGGAGSGANAGGDGGTAADFTTYETINITSTGAVATAANAFTGGTGGASGAGGAQVDGATGTTVTVSANTTINISGANDINLGTITNSNTPVTINAGSLTGKLTVNTGTAADVITGGSKAVTLGLLGGADTVDISKSSAVADTLNVSAATTSTATAFASITGFTNAATTGDKLDFQGGTGTVLAGAGTVVDLGATVTGLTGALSASGILTFSGSGAANATLANKIAIGFSSDFMNTNQDKAIAFEHSGNTYVLYSDGGAATFNANADVVVALVGLTGVTGLSASASAANTILIA
jgi:hypothetical protein